MSLSGTGVLRTAVPPWERLWQPPGETGMRSRGGREAGQALCMAAVKQAGLGAWAEAGGAAGDAGRAGGSTGGRALGVSTAPLPGAASSRQVRLPAPVGFGKCATLNVPCTAG